MSEHEKVNILLVDDQSSKLLTYEAILNNLGENLIKASSGREALEHLLKSEIAVVLLDVCMPDLDGFQLAAMIREHPRYQKTAMIFISAIQISELDRLRGYEMGAVDYVPVPVIPEVLRAKVRVFAELYRKTRQLEQMNADLEARVAFRTSELEASTDRLRESEQRRSLALIAGNMGSWDWSHANGDCIWDDGQYRIFGVDRENFRVSAENVRALVHPEDWAHLQTALDKLLLSRQPAQMEFRIKRPNGEIRWCMGTAAPSLGTDGQVERISGVTADITDRKQSEERQNLLAREVDHRAKNSLALVQSILRLTKGTTIEAYTASVEGRIRSLSRAHAILSQSRWQGADIRGLVDEELAPYRVGDGSRIVAQGPNVSLQPAAAQSLALALHEMATNAAKYGALSTAEGRVNISWDLNADKLTLNWKESGGPPARAPSTVGFGTRIIASSIQGQLGGEATFNWCEEGLRCLLIVPQKQLTATQHHPSQGVPIVQPPQELQIKIASGRVMIVEDEALVAMALGETLAEAGLAVLGPFSRVSDALVALRHSEIDAAVLDVNLGGESIYPLADVLAAEQVPFIFITGYTREAIDPRFADIPVLQKPIERDILLAMFHRAARPAPTGIPDRTH